MATEEENLDKKLAERFAQLPKVVQDAITSADVEKRLRTLADSHKLHLDQWEALENEVMLALLGFSPVEELSDNLESEVGLDKETATILATDISKTVFEPIRAELERDLEHKEAKEKPVSDIDVMREQVLSKEKSAATSNEAPLPTPMPPVEPATPPATPNEKKAERGPTSGEYKPGEASSSRKSVIDDPYREPPQ